MSPSDETPARPLDEGLTTAALAGRTSAPAQDPEPRSFAADAPVGAEPPSREPVAAPSAETAPLFPGDVASDLRTRWDAVQAGFVDEPRRAVEQADSLVASAMKRLAETFAEERSTLEAQWDRGGDVSTEDLRIALQRYRSFFGRLLSM